METTNSRPSRPRGLLLVDKPVGPTSHDIVRRARKATGVRRIGHTGTLDPFATGLLLLCVGDTTRLAEYFHVLPKSYETDICLGLETTTDDRTGEPVRQSEAWCGVSEADVERGLQALTGTIAQVPPDYSAKRQDGRRAYEKARAGEHVDLPAASVTIHTLTLRAFDPPVIRVGAVVSTGTYVRALGRDLGRLLGCGAHLSGLRRTGIGSFRVEDALPVAELGGDRDVAGFYSDFPRAWRRAEDALPWLPRRQLEADEERRVRHGGAIAATGFEPATEPSAPVLVTLFADDRFVAVARLSDGMLQPSKVFSGA